MLFTQIRYSPSKYTIKVAMKIVILTIKYMLLDKNGNTVHLAQGQNIH